MIDTLTGTGILKSILTAKNSRLRTTPVEIISTQWAPSTIRQHFHSSIVTISESSIVNEITVHT